MSDNGNIASPELRNDDVLLDVQHLTKLFAAETNFFGKATSYVHAVDDVSFQIKRGEAFGLVGESGCGKTTVGKMLVNLLRPTSGKIIFDGKDLTAMKDSERKSYCKDIQLIFQDPYASLNPRMRIGDIIAEPMIANNIVPKDKVEARVNELLECVGLANYMRNRYPHEFSGGQRQRVGIARALAVNPKLIVCDEPVSALDVSIQAQVINMFDDLRGQVGAALPVHRAWLKRREACFRSRGCYVFGQDHGDCPEALALCRPVVPLHAGAAFRYPCGRSEIEARAHHLAR